MQGIKDHFPYRNNRNHHLVLSGSFLSYLDCFCFGISVYSFSNSAHRTVCFLEILLQSSSIIVLDLTLILTKYTPLSYFPFIKYFGLPISNSCPVYRNVNDEEMCISFVNFE